MTTTTAADAIQAESLRRLVHRAWAGDLAATCAALQSHLASHDTHRARLAAVLLAGAANDTSRRLALRLVADWFPAELDECLTG